MRVRAWRPSCGDRRRQPPPSAGHAEQQHRHVPCERLEQAATVDADVDPGTTGEQRDAGGRRRPPRHASGQGPWRRHPDDALGHVGLGRTAGRPWVRPEVRLDVGVVPEGGVHPRDVGHAPGGTVARSRRRNHAVQRPSGMTRRSSACSAVCSAQSWKRSAGRLFHGRDGRGRRRHAQCGPHTYVGAGMPQQLARPAGSR